MSVPDAQFLSLVEDCSAIEALQVELKKKLSDGIFGMTIARKGGCWVNAENLREDFDASVTVSADGTGDAFAVWEKKPDIDPLLLVSGLPPPSLKKSQKHFSAAVWDIVDLANIVVRIQRVYTRFNKCDQNLDVGLENLTVS